MRTNILCQYQGGGYDGCFWEWNYFYIDKQGGFHNIAASGRAGRSMAALNRYRHGMDVARLVWPDGGTN